MSKRSSKGTRALLEEMGALGDFGDFAPEITGAGVKVISIVLERIRPDPAQPRRVLPEMIRSEFLAGYINARQALERWEALVVEEANRFGRPRPDWKALLERNPEDHGEDLTIDTPGQPGPEEELLRSIVATAATIRHGGQVSPITVIEMDSGSYYRIETGERRYWAYHWLNMWLSNGYDQIQCIVVPGASPWRQAAENTSREGLSAMALARQLATLLLDIFGIHPDYSGPISNDWYRQALDYRVPRGEGSTLRAALGGIERSQFSRIQALLRLPDSVWELADRCRLEEKRLRYVLKVEDEARQLQLVRLIVENNLSAERVQQVVESGTLEAFLRDEEFGKSHAGSEETISERVATRWPSLASQVAKADLTVVADQWIRRQRPEEVRAQLAALRRLIELVEKRLRR
jgi:ParB-like chromosome segregation protein Spo0J